MAAGAKPALAAAAILLFFSATGFAAAPGLDAYRNDNYTEAYRQFEKTLQEHPNTHAADRIEFDAGTAAYKLGDYNKALEWFSRSLLSKDKAIQEKSHYNIGRTLEERADRAQTNEKALGELNNAQSHYEEAVKLDPDDERAKANLEEVKKKIERLKQHPKQSPTPPPQPPQSQKNKNQNKNDQQQKDQQQKNDQDQQQQQSSSNDQQQQQQAKNDKKQQPPPNESPSPSPGEEQQQQNKSGSSPSPSPDKGSGPEKQENKQLELLTQDIEETLGLLKSEHSTGSTPSGLKKCSSQTTHFKNENVLEGLNLMPFALIRAQCNNRTQRFRKIEHNGRDMFRIGYNKPESGKNFNAFRLV